MSDVETSFAPQSLITVFELDDFRLHPKQGLQMYR